MAASYDLIVAFLHLRDHCIWTRTCFNTFVDMFESGDERHQTMNRVAPHFFHDLNRILHQNYILEVCKLSDPPYSTVIVEVEGKKTRQKRENLTVALVNELLAAEGLLTPGIEEATAGIMRYRALIEMARNRAIGHADKETAISNGILGIHSRPEALAFLEDLQAYVDAVGTAVGQGPVDFSATGGAGDVSDLFTALKEKSPPPAGCGG